ncbi:DNA-binding protein (plasmid) [Acinetobacter sp. YH12138]|uniref:phage antirepressor KilAC domain-containing protein n=2 Tax=Acinetobacter sp. YH12138 TaxID=2601122 RepID=UPI00187E5275|nr:phage antirepressor KilAC domain-containing protein [Acinetobacter sp. YH12138]QOW51625.1 DNA-binding protein [Acinetobacter sp. YH12138]
MTSLSLQTTNSTLYNTAIVTANNVVKMTSQQIADLVQLRHDNVKRTIETLVNSGVIVQPQIEDGIKSANGVIPKLYVFEGDQGERDTTIIVAQLSPQFLGQVVDQWRFLKQQMLEMVRPSYMIEDPVARAKKWIEEQTAKQEAEAKLLEAAKAIEVMQPTVDAYELIAGKKGSMCFQDAYKFLGGIKLKEMKQWMYDKKWINKDRFGRDSIGYYQNMNGYLVEKVTTHQPQIRITYKGLAAMARQMKIKLNAEDFN